MLYFYPKDNTPGCTKEACSFRDGYSALQEAGIVILGISSDSLGYAQDHLPCVKRTETILQR